MKKKTTLKKSESMADEMSDEPCEILSIKAEGKDWHVPTMKHLENLESRLEELENKIARTLVVQVFRLEQKMKTMDKFLNGQAKSIGKKIKQVEQRLDGHWTAIDRIDANIIRIEEKLPCYRDEKETLQRNKVIEKLEEAIQILNQ